MNNISHVGLYRSNNQTKRNLSKYIWFTTPKNNIYYTKQENYRLSYACEIDFNRAEAYN